MFGQTATWSLEDPSTYGQHIQLEVQEEVHDDQAELPLIKADPESESAKAVAELTSQSEDTMAHYMQVITLLLFFKTFAHG